MVGFVREGGSAMTDVTEGYPDRVETLAAQIRRLRITVMVSLATSIGVLLVFLGGCTLLVLVSIQTAGAVDAQRLVLRDDNGKGRLWMNLDPGGPIIGMVDSRGETRMRMDVVGNEPSLTFYDENGKGRLILSASSNTPNILVLDRKGEVVFSKP